MKTASWAEVGRMRVLAFLILLGSIASAQIKPVETVETQFALRCLAAEHSLSSFLSPSIQGRVAAPDWDRPLSESLSTIPADQAHIRLLKLGDRKLLVAARKRGSLNRWVSEAMVSSPFSEQGGRALILYLLDEAPARAVVQFLQEDYTEVAFLTHPGKNGFYAWGTSEDLLQIKRDLADGSRVPDPVPDRNGWFTNGTTHPRESE